MPKVTNAPGCSSAIWAAAWTARPNSRAGSMTWSAGVTRMVASGSSLAMRAAPRATQGAVSRPTGSPTRWPGGSSGSCAAVSPTYAWPVTIQQRLAGRPAASSLSLACCNRVRSPARARNCLGRAARLRGQNRVPPPPAMIIACSIEPSS